MPETSSSSITNGGDGVITSSPDCRQNVGGDDMVGKGSELKLGKTSRARVWPRAAVAVSPKEGAAVLHGSDGSKGH